MRIAHQVVLRIDQRTKLESHARAAGCQPGWCCLAEIVLLAAEGNQDIEITRLLSLVPRTAARWRSSFLRNGIAGLEPDAPRGPAARPPPHPSSCAW